MTLCRISLLALLTLTSSLALAQTVADDRDVDLFNQFESLQYQTDSLDLVGPLDMESDPSGRIVLAYAVHSEYFQCGTVRVMYGTRDRVTQVTSWRFLANLEMDCSGLDPNRVKAVSVAAIRGRAFVAVVFEARGSDWLGFYDGGVKVPWPTRPFNLAVLTGQRAKPVGDDQFMAPSIGIIPHVRGDFTKFSVGIAYTAQSASGTPQIEMQWADFSQPRAAWFVHQIAGAPGALIQGSFTRPSLAADDRGPSWAVAFEEVARKKVRVIAGDGSATPQNDRLMFTSSTESKRHHPTLRSHEGTAVLAALGDMLDAGVFSLEWATGDFFDPMSWRNQPQISNRCRTPADLDISRGIATAVAQCWDGTRMRVGAYELDRQRMTASRFVPVDDVSGTGRQPRVAVGPPGTLVFTAIGYATEVPHPLPDTVHGYKVLMFDP